MTHRPYSNRDRALAQVRRNQTAAVKQRYQHFPQRIVMGFDLAHDELVAGTAEAMKAALPTAREFGKALTAAFSPPADRR